MPLNRIKCPQIKWQQNRVSDKNKCYTFDKKTTIQVLKEKK